MIGLSELFKRIQGIQAREIQARTAVQEAIKKLTGADVSIGSISISSSTVTLKESNSSLRSAIFIKKSAIIEEINRNQTIKKITDLR